MTWPARIIPVLVLMSGGIQTYGATEVNWNFPVDDIKVIKISCMVAGVQFETGPAGELGVEYSAGGDTDARCDARLSRDGSELDISEEAEGSVHEELSSIRIQVPLDHPLRLLSVTTTQGGVGIGSLDCKEYEIESKFGNIVLNSVSADRVYVACGTGGIILKGGAVIDAARLSSGSGNVEAELDTAPAGFLSMCSASGSVSLSMPLGENYFVSCKMNSGFGHLATSLDCTRRVIASEDDGSDFDLDVCESRNGTGIPEISLVTGSGDILFQPRTSD